MRLRVLGCHGGETSSHRASSFLIDQRLALDAGSLTRALTLNEQTKIDYVVVSHSHLDHTRDLALLTDNVFAARNCPVEVFCSAATADALMAHMFNNVMWPDFTKIPNPADPAGGAILAIRRMETGETLKAGEYELKAVRVQHPAECHAAFVRGSGGTLVYTGDTGPTDELWREINRLSDLRALICEVSFPNDMDKLAKLSGHFTPQMLAAELKKYRPKTDAPVLLYHLKPRFHDVLRSEIADLADARITILKPMDEFDL